MNLKEIRYFVHVARAGSFNRAAGELNIAQPALSRQVRKLEEELGVDLFVRHGRGISLTNAGSVLLDGAETINQLISRTSERVRAGGENVAGHIAFGVPPAAGLLIAPPAVQAFRKEWPHVSLHVREGISSSLQEWLLDRRIDVAVLHNPPPLDGVDIKPILTEQMVLVAPRLRGARPPFPGVKSVQIRDIIDLPLIMPCSPHSNRRLLDQAAVRNGVRLRLVFEVDSVVLTKAMVKRGQGCTILTLAAVQEEVARGEVYAYPIVRPPLTTTLSIATLREARPSRFIESLSGILGKVMRGLVADGTWHGASTRVMALAKSKA
jgi:LysR family nitrogen assimilation transcriptional regulator